jgi:4-amino-4-deoxy-L-arabinose transferase-like glycosyltransferase
MEPDEARYSDIPSLMNRSGDYVTPHLDHVVYLEKPPLCYWVTALLFKIFGENEFSSRLFSALCAWGCILLVYRIGRFFHDEKTGLYSAGVLSTFLYFSILGKINILDIPLTFFVSLATWAGYRYFAGDCERKGWLYLLYVSSGLAFLTKGLIGIVFPFAITIVWLLISMRWRDVLKLISPVGIILFLLISCPWIILIQRANKDFLWFFFIQEHFLRYATRESHRGHGIFFFVPVVILGTLPWSAFLWKVLREGAEQRISFFKTTERHFLLVWIFFIFVFFSISKSKLVPYVAPMFLPIAIFFGNLFRSYEDSNISLKEGMRRRLLYNLPIILQPLIFAALIILPLLIKNAKLDKYLENYHLEKWWWLLMLPILFQVMMTFLPALVRQRWRRGWFLTMTVLSALFLISMHFPIARFVTPYRSAYPLSKAIHEFLPPNQELFQYRMSLYGIDFYNKIRTPRVDACGELEYGFIHLRPGERSHYYLSSGTFSQRCRENGLTYCVTRRRENVEELRRRASTVEVLWDNGEFYLLRLRF